MRQSCAVRLPSLSSVSSCSASLARRHCFGMGGGFSPVRRRLDSLASDRIEASIGIGLVAHVCSAVVLSGLHRRGSWDIAARTSACCVLASHVADGSTVRKIPLGRLTHHRHAGGRRAPAAPQESADRHRGLIRGRSSTEHRASTYRTASLLESRGGAHAEREDVRRYRENWQDEVDSAAEYRRDGRDEADPRLARVSPTWADGGSAHRLLGGQAAQGGGDGQLAPPSWRSRVSPWIAQRFGPTSYSPPSRRVRKPTRLLHDAAEASGTRMPAQERWHAKVLGQLGPHTAARPEGGFSAGSRAPPRRRCNALRAAVLAPTMACVRT